VRLAATQRLRHKHLLLTLPMWELWNGKDQAEPFDGICKMIETSLDPLGVGAKHATFSVAPQCTDNPLDR
jgi:hypothetical protein